MSAADHEIRPAMWPGKCCSLTVRHPTRCYASTNHRGRRAVYLAVCSKRVTLPGKMWIGPDSKRMVAELTKRLDVKRPSIRGPGDMIGIPLPNILD
jgi:hypothetical protein